jgi:RND family efflux transporter MFP subunit
MPVSTIVRIAEGQIVVISLKFVASSRYSDQEDSMDVRHSIVSGCLLLFAISALCGCSNGTASVGGADSSTDGTADGPTRVRTIQPERITLRRTTTQPVTVTSYHEAEIEAKVSGYVKELNVDIGDVVKQGDVLAVLDVPEMVKEMEQQQAVIARLNAEEKQATAAVTLAFANIKAAEATLAQAESEVQQADADLKAEQAEFARIEELVTRRSVEARMEDEARQRLESAEAARSAALASIRSAQASVTVAEAQLDSAKAEVDRAQAETAVARKLLERMQTMMQYTSLTAPFDGVVTSRNVDLGDLVGGTPSTSRSRVALFTLAQVDRVRVRAAIPEDHAPWTTVGDPATVHLSALRGEPIAGTVSRITRSLDASTRTMLAEVDLENADGRLLPGMYGEASFVLDEKVDALVLPAGAVRFDSEGNAQVYAVGVGSTVQVVDVTTGVDDGHQIEIISGLSADATVIDGMLDRLSAGQKVQVDE